MSSATGDPDVTNAIYFEHQNGMLCAQHALNMLLQGNYFTAVNLADIAHELDEQEKAVLDDQSNWRSQNLDDSGYFSIQVIQTALQNSWELSLTPFNSPNVAEFSQNPEKANAYICNLNEHWFVLRKFHEQWYTLNSLHSGPKAVTNSYLSLYLQQLIEEGYAIFVVGGFLPQSEADNIAKEKAVLAESLQSAAHPPPSAPNLEDDEEWQIEAAIAASLSDAAQQGGKPQEPPAGNLPSQQELDEEADLERALRESLAESEANQPGSSKSPPPTHLPPSSGQHTNVGQAAANPSPSVATPEQLSQAERLRNQRAKFLSRFDEQNPRFSPEMSVLSALVADEPPASVASTDTVASAPASINNGEASSLEDLLHDAADLQPSALGNAVNNVVIQWNQLVSHMIGDVGHTQPAPDHVKELAEYSVRQIRDACLEVTAEFHRTALEWRQMHPEEALKEDIADYREAVNRQNQLLNHVEQNLDASLQRHQQYTRTS